MESVKVGKCGAIIVPARLPKRFGIEEGMLVTAEEREDGILIRSAVILPVENLRHSWLPMTNPAAQD